MTGPSIQHGTFVIDRVFDASPARAFAAWSRPEAKARWFCGPDGASADYSLDFRVGGREINRGGPPGGAVYTYEARYLNILPDARIVYAYTMDEGETRISATVATVEFSPAPRGTRVVLTEQGAFLDGKDTVASRERGTLQLFDQLAASLAGQPPRT